MANIRLTWSPNPVDQLVEVYKVFEQVDGGAYTLVGEVAEPTILREDLAPGAYAWQVSAVNVAGEGPKSQTVGGPAVPTAPSGLTASVE
ncbi:MAG: hypothetical protein ACYST6_05720 [Planctomycetota bacterium]|jgi:hypothetical protein